MKTGTITTAQFQSGTGRRQKPTPQTFVIVYPGQTVIGPYRTFERAKSDAQRFGPNWLKIVQIWAVEPAATAFRDKT